MSDYTPTTEQVRDLCHLGAIDAAGHEDNLDHEELLSMFDRWLAGVITQAKIDALEGFADDLRHRYPEDVFRPMTRADHRAVNDALAGRAERTHVTRDQVSADMMRRAAEQAADRADEYRSTGNEDTK